MKLTFWLFIFTVSLLHSINIDYKNVHLENYTLEYYKDLNQTKTIDSIQKVHLKSISNRHGFSGENGSVWYKLNLNNTTQLQQELYLHFHRAHYAKGITVYELEANKLLTQEHYNPLDDKDSTKLIGSTVLHQITLNPHMQKTIYIKYDAMVSHIFFQSIYSEKSSYNALIQKPFYSIVIISIILTLALYNATLYFFNKRKEFLLYALYLVTPGLGLLYKYGILFNHFEFYGENAYWFNLTAIVMPAFLILFVQQTLNTKEMIKKIDIILNTVLFIIILNMLSAFIIDLTFAMELFKGVFFLTVIAVSYLIIHLFKTSHPLAIIFTAAYSFYFLGLIITIFAMSGLIQMNFFTFHSGGLGIIIEGVLFSYLMHNNVKILEQKVNAQREMIIKKNKKEQLGDMINAITHQWKQPLSRITSITSALEFKLDTNTKIQNHELQNKIENINKDIHFLSDTIDDFKGYFNPNIEREECNLNTLINKAISLSQDNTLDKQITISTHLDFTNNVFIYKNELLHILLNIIQNSKEAFNHESTEIKLIKIIGYSKDSNIYIDIIDNAGGIKEEDLPFIFNEHYTSKVNDGGNGLGLYLSKVILQNHLKGSIEVQNTGDGAMFRIIL